MRLFVRRRTRLPCAFKCPEDIGSGAVDDDEFSGSGDKAHGDDVIGCCAAEFGGCAEASELLVVLLRLHYLHPSLRLSVLCPLKVPGN